MLTRDYYFDLPGELIAQVPTDRRGEERLLVLDKKSGSYKDMMMKDFPSLIEPGSVMVVNNSRVRKARCYGESETGGTVEFLFLEENADHSWNAMVSKAKRQRVGRRYRFLDGEGALVEEAVIVAENEDGTRRVSFSHPLEEDFFTRCGHVPLPPYIKGYAGDEEMQLLSSWTQYYAPYYNTMDGFTTMRTEWWNMLQRVLANGGDPQTELDTYVTNSNAAITG